MADEQKPVTQMSSEELDAYVSKKLAERNPVGGMSEAEVSAALQARAKKVAQNPKFQTPEAQSVLSGAVNLNVAQKIKDKFSTTSVEGISITPTSDTQKPAAAVPESEQPKGIGWLVKKYESGNDTGAIGYDKIGGISTGRFQFAEKFGVPQEFVKSLETTLPYAYRILSKTIDTIGKGRNSAFVKGWKSLSDDADFQAAEFNFAYKKYFTKPFKELEKSGFADRFKNDLMKEVFFSTSIQHGDYAINVIKKALSADPNMTDERFIIRLYNIRKTLFGKSSKQVREGAQKRLESEKQEVLGMLPKPKEDKNKSLEKKAKSS